MSNSVDRRSSDHREFGWTLDTARRIFGVLGPTHSSDCNAMTRLAITSPDDQGATFVELFFDLVFVFAITQVTHYAAHHLDLHGLMRSALVFWMIWWGWTQFTWTLNAANTEHHHVRFSTLVATVVAFIMAVSVERAFSIVPAEAMSFAVAYVAGRGIGLWLYYKVVADDPEHRAAVGSFASLSLSGMVAVVLGCLVDPGLREWVWLGAIGLDFVAMAVAGRGSWQLHAGHFAERHGLIVIIALGESLIVAASALTGELTPALVVSGGLSVVVACLLWWTYFGWVQGLLEESLVAKEGPARSLLARDAYSVNHFPLVAGIVALAVGIEAAVHPDDYSLVEASVALVAGLTLFLAATALSLLRAVGCVLWNRLIVIALVLSVVPAGLSLGLIKEANHVLGLAVVALLTIVTIEQLTVKKKLKASASVGGEGGLDLASH